MALKDQIPRELEVRRIAASYLRRYNPRVTNRKIAVKYFGSTQEAGEMSVYALSESPLSLLPLAFSASYRSML
jgi:hypothetical protein